MKYAEINTIDAIRHPVSGVTTNVLRDVEAELHPWGYLIGDTEVPFARVRYARRDLNAPRETLDDFMERQFPEKPPVDDLVLRTPKKEKRR